MSERDQLLVYVAVTSVTVVGLFSLYFVYESILDYQVRAGWADAPVGQAVGAARSKEAEALRGMEGAIQALASGPREASAIAPKASEDLSALSGWIHRPGFMPVTSFPSEPVAVQHVEATPVQARLDTVSAGQQEHASPSGDHPAGDHGHDG